MARMTGAVQRILPENSSADNISPRVVILHSAVGSNSLYNYFKENSSLESHFWVGLDGEIEQYMDTEKQADANYKANDFAISVETADNGDPDHFPWTGPQMNSLAEIIVWANKRHGIPIVRCNSWDGRGIGFHTMWGAPSNWTPVAKSCPGTIRKTQFDDVIELAKLKAAKPPVEEKDMELSDEINLSPSQLEFLTDRGVVPEVTADDKTPDLDLSWFISWGHIRQLETLDALRVVTRQNDRIIQQNDELNRNFGNLVLALDALTKALVEEDGEDTPNPI